MGDTSRLTSHAMRRTHGQRCRTPTSRFPPRRRTLRRFCLRWTPPSSSCWSSQTRTASGTCTSQGVRACTRVGVASCISACHTALNAQCRFLWRRPPLVNVEDAAEYLLMEGKAQAAALLYQGRGMWKQALDIWRTIGLKSEDNAVHDDVEQEAVSSGASVAGASTVSGRSSDAARPRVDSLSEDGLLVPPASLLQSEKLTDVGGAEAASRRLAYVPPLSVSASSGVGPNRLNGIEDSIEILRRMEDVLLIFECAEWLLQSAPERALRVFTHPLRRVMIAPEEVIDYLGQPRFQVADNVVRSFIGLRLYLEHLVFVCGRDEGRFHTRLIQEYITVINALRSNAQYVVQFVLPVCPGDAAEVARSTAADGSGRREEYVLKAISGNVLARPLAGSEKDKLGPLRRKLIGLLQESDSYDAPAVDAWLQETTLYEERIVVAARQGDHVTALRLLTFEMAWHEGAIAYCMQMSSSRYDTKAVANPATLLPGSAALAALNAGGGMSIPAWELRESHEDNPCFILMQLYLDYDADEVEQLAADRVEYTTPPQERTYIVNLLRMLQRLADRMNPAIVASRLPDFLPLTSVLPFWAAVVPQALHARYEATAVHHQYKSIGIRVQNELVQQQRRSVLIDRGTTCFVCSKRIGDSVFCVLPGNLPVHLGCREGAGTFHQQKVDDLFGAKKLGFVPSEEVPFTAPPHVISMFPGSNAHATSYAVARGWRRPPPPPIENEDALADMFHAGIKRQASLALGGLSAAMAAGSSSPSGGGGGGGALQSA
ncbi:hypothetical protein EON62_01795, partial [archaeon]